MRACLSSLAILAILACGIVGCDRAPADDAVLYQCGDLPVSATFPDADTAKLLLQGRTLTLQRVPAASGAKYADAAGNEFWTREGAMLTLAAQPMRQCSRAQR
jgi:membrane-bound inhibitor of C-type lysozyme